MIFALLIGCTPQIEQKPIKDKIIEQCNDEIIVSETAKNITDVQKQTAIIIEKNFNNLQIPKNITAAAIVNGIVESGLKSKAIGDNGNSVGIFQLNKFGLGHKMTVEQRQNININSTVIAVQIIKSQFLLTEEKQGASIPELSSMFAETIMRPAEIKKQKVLRYKIAKKTFPNKISVKCITS